MATWSTRLRDLAWNDRERRPRALLRILLAAALVVVSAVGTGVLLVSLLGGADPVPVLLAAALGAQSVPGIAVLLAARALDRRELSDLGLRIDRDWWLDLGFGLGLGAALMTGIFLLALSLGWVRVEGWFAVESAPMGFGPGFAAMTALFLVVGVSEELVARGYLLTNVAEGLAGYGSRGFAVGVAVLLSSLLFGVAHMTNPNATAASTLGISLAGVLLAAGYVLTGELAVPIGLHVTWNFFQGPVYGFPVSGLGFGVSVVDTAETGPDVATGGAFGPEAGLLGVAAVGVGLAATAAYARLRYGEAAIDPGLTAPDLRWRGG